MWPDIFADFPPPPLPGPALPARPPRVRQVATLDDAWISPLFWATIEATEEAIVNALVAAETMTGVDGHTAHALPHDRLQEIWARHTAARRS